MKFTITLLFLLSASAFAQDTHDCIQQDTGKVISVNGHSDWQCDWNRTPKEWLPQYAPALSQPLAKDPTRVRDDEHECMNPSGKMIKVNGHSDWQCL